MNNPFANLTQQQLELLELAINQLNIEATYRPTQWREATAVRVGLQHYLHEASRAPAAGQDSHFVDQKA